MSNKKYKEIKTNVGVQITNISTTNDHVRIEIKDKKSRLPVAIIELTYEQFGLIISGRDTWIKDGVPATLFQSDNHGKNAINKTFEFEIPFDCTYENRKKITCDTVLKVCPDGWYPDLNFNSRDSFRVDYENNKHYAKTTIRSYVDDEEEIKNGK
jgi:hypothetical protein